LALSRRLFQLFGSATPAHGSSFFDPFDPKQLEEEEEEEAEAAAETLSPHSGTVGSKKHCSPVDCHRQKRRPEDSLKFWKRKYDEGLAGFCCPPTANQSSSAGGWQFKGFSLSPSLSLPLSLDSLSLSISLLIASPKRFLSLSLSL
jgi:hypothetical protein